MPEPTRVLIIEEAAWMAEKLAAVLRDIPGIEVAGHAASVNEAQDSLLAIRPEIVVLSVDSYQGNARERLRRVLAAAPWSRVICASARRDDSLAKAVLQEGAAACLPKPFTAQEFTAAVEAVPGGAALAPDAGKGKVVAAFSSKGGCGKSFLVANVAVGLAAETGRSVGVVDANPLWGSIAAMYNIHPTVSLFEAARDLKYVSPVTFGSYLTPYKELVKVLAAPALPEQAELIRGDDVTAIAAMLREVFRYTVIDTPSGFNEISLAAAQAADAVYLVAALNTGRELDNVRRSLTEFARLGYPRGKVRVVLTRVRSRDLDLLKSVEAELGYPVTALVPNNFPAVVAAINRGEPLWEAGRDSPCLRGIDDIVKDILDGEPLPAEQPEKPKLKRLWGWG